MNTEALYQSLNNLYVKAYEKIISARNTDALIKIPYEKIRVNNLDFKMGHTSFQYDWDNIEYFDYYDWDSNVFSNFMNSELNTLPEYEIAAEEICKIFEIPEENKIFAKRAGLSGFLSLLMKQIPNRIITDQNIEKYINTFINDYKIYKTDNLFNWHVKVWLRNVHFENTEIKLNTCLIRKPVKDELTETRPKSYHIDLFQKLGRSIFATCVLEYL